MKVSVDKEMLELCQIAITLKAERDLYKRLYEELKNDK